MASGTECGLSGRERLRDWVDRYCENQGHGAEILEIHPVMLSQILSGKRTPGLATAIRIEHRTGISVESWVLKEISNGKSWDGRDRRKSKK